MVTTSAAASATPNGRRVIAIACLALGLFSLGARAENLTVPQDASLTIARYIDLGVPDPKGEWSGEDYLQALDVLSSLPRDELPRVGSSRSRALFDRLLLSYLQAVDPDSSQAAPQPADHVPTSLPDLYSMDPGDGLLFDRELVEIRSKALRFCLDTLSTRAQFSALKAGAAQVLGTAGSEADRARVVDSVVELESTAKQVSAEIKHRVLDLLLLASVPETDDAARHALIVNASDLFPRLPRFLGADDLGFIATTMREAASSPFNAVIRTELRQLAAKLDGASQEAG